MDLRTVPAIKPAGSGHEARLPGHSSVSKGALEDGSTNAAQREAACNAAAANAIEAAWTKNNLAAAMYSKSTSTQGIHRKTKMRRRAATETETTEDAGPVSRAEKREDSDNSDNEAGGRAVVESKALGKPTTSGLRNKPAHNYAEDLDMVDAPLEDASDALEEYHNSRTTSHNACTSAADGDCSHPPVTQTSPSVQFETVQPHHSGSFHGLTAHWHEPTIIIIQG